MQCQAEANAGLRVGQLLECEVSGLSHDGRGVVALAGSVAFVGGAVPGDRVRLRLEHRARRHWLARLEAVLEPSAQRCRPACVLADRCGGCSLQHLELQAQRQWKRRQVVDALQRIAHLPAAEQLVATGISAGEGLGYRNRATLPLERRPDGTLRAGYYRHGSHTLVNVNHCPVLDPRLDQLVAPLKHDLESSPWPVDRHLQAEGGLRHLALRLGQHSGELLVTLVSSHGNLPGLERWAERWLQRWPQLVGVCLNIQDRPTNVLLGPHTEVVAGRGWIEERFAGLSLSIGADTFFQVNTPMAEQVVPLLLEGLEGLEPGLLLDAYWFVLLLGIRVGRCLNPVDSHFPEFRAVNIAYNRHSHDVCCSVGDSQRHQVTDSVAEIGVATVSHGPVRTHCCVAGGQCDHDTLGLQPVD